MKFSSTVVNLNDDDAIEPVCLEQADPSAVKNTFAGASVKNTSAGAVGKNTSAGAAVKITSAGSAVKIT
ncbi:hypothetical protein A2U01_0103947, partial [Trifolium medium]|nr:hypothetical protein [Trifolium medium]